MKLSSSSVLTLRVSQCPVERGDNANSRLRTLNLPGLALLLDPSLPDITLHECADPGLQLSQFLKPHHWEY